MTATATRARDLRAEVRVWLAEHGEGSLELIARGVHARASDVRAVLLGDGFSRDQAPRLRREGPVVFRLDTVTRDGLGRAGRAGSQTARAYTILTDGCWHDRAEFAAAGVQCVNSRIAELRRAARGGHRITCKRIDGSYAYRLVDRPSTSEER